MFKLYIVTCTYEHLSGMNEMTAQYHLHITYFTIIALKTLYDTCMVLKIYIYKKFTLLDLI
jgi:hypothetical protein